jgi:hypothetical protein
MFASLLTLAAALPLLVLGAPSGRTLNLNLASVRPLSNIVSCPTTSAVLSLPGNQTTLAVPAGQKPINIALGIGTQNYTCSSAGTYTYVISFSLIAMREHRMTDMILSNSSAGAVAKFFDISCLVGTPGFARIQDDIMNLPKPIRDGIVNAAARTPLLIAEHYFITNPITGSGISPKFAQSANGGSTYVTVAKAGNVPSPQGSANIDWLQLKQIDGTWAQTVFRVDTKAGQPPASCNPNNTSVFTVPYAAKYCE